ncbi:MAG TPA: Lrp/AsnC family transcriptional regulator [Dongiaceae bacterium]|nr:Lrp/AsnC family transcriptional regulator [Dongiaceae bacterium]
MISPLRTLDDKDRKILDLLRQDARLPLKTLAAKVGLARSSLRDRLSRLEADGIIRGYRAEIAAPAFGVAAYLFVRLKRTPALDLIEALRTMPGVRSCVSLTGDVDLLVELSASSTDEVNAIRDRISAHESVADLTTSIVLNRNI